LLKITIILNFFLKACTA